MKKTPRTCDYYGYKSAPSGWPDMDKIVVCLNFATKSIKYKGVKARKYYCFKHLTA